MASLESLWKEGRKGALCPLEQMRAWALRVTQRDLLGGEGAVNYAAIADRVTKVGGGHPGRDAIRQFLDRVDADPDWYPGKNYRTRSGPAPVLRGTKRRQVAKSAMDLKKGGGEPTYPAIAARCPAGESPNLSHYHGPSRSPPAPAPAPPGTLRIPGAPVNFP